MLFPRAILWDMDGVLADTSPLHFETWEQLLTAQGIPFDRQKFTLIYGLKSQDLLSYLVAEPMEAGQIKWLADQKEQAFRQALPGRLSLLPGVLKWLQHFNSMGYRQAVASSAPPENVEALVRELGISKYFSALVTPGSLPGKPDPAVFLLAAHQLGVIPGDCVVIEDSIPGIEAAIQAGMHCIAVATTNPLEVLTHADIAVETLEQLTLQQFESLF
jgi:HAD superfamily hydrolase (TIGR01509 family)